MDEMRKAFEAHCAGTGLDTSRVMDGPYKDASTQRAWEEWQALPAPDIAGSQEARPVVSLSEVLLQAYDRALAMERKALDRYLSGE